MCNDHDIMNYCLPHLIGLASFHWSELGTEAALNQTMVPSLNNSLVLHALRI